MNKFLDSIYFRHSCKLFDENKKIPKEVFDEILEVGRLSPSSFGLEPTRLLVLRSDEAKAALRPYSGESLAHWSSKQAYIMATYMVAYASFLEIDTCYIEGYEKRAVEKLYGLDPFKEQVSLIVCFGYRGKEQQPRYRISLDDLVEYK